MSRYTKSWVLVVLTILALLGLSVPAMADDPPPAPSAPTPSDGCGVSGDQVFTPAGATGTDVGWKDATGSLYGTGQWSSTNGASTLTLTAMVWGESGYAEYTYPAMAFSTEPDSACVEALDTVTTRIVSCNSQNNGTRVEFTYTNVDDATNRWHTKPYVYVKRWDDGQTAQMWPSWGRVEDGASASIIGGDTAWDAGANEFFLTPGTYSMTLRTDETVSRVLPNRLFVPACGTAKPPAGDPMGGATPVVSRPKAVIKACNVRTNRVRVLLDARKATGRVKYRLVVNPRRGKTVVRIYRVPAKTMKVVVLKRQRTGTVVKVSFAGKVVKRRLRC